MKMQLQLTALAHGNIANMKDTLGKGNLVTFVKEDNDHGMNGVAYQAFAKDVGIGYLPNDFSVDLWTYITPAWRNVLIRNIHYIHEKLPESFRSKVVEANLQGNFWTVIVEVVK